MQDGARDVFRQRAMVDESGVKVPNTVIFYAVYSVTLMGVVISRRSEGTPIVICDPRFDTRRTLEMLLASPVLSLLCCNLKIKQSRESDRRCHRISGRVLPRRWVF